MRYHESKWDYRFLDLAFTIAKWSKDPSTKVGAVLVSDKQIVSLGYNGLPRKLNDEGLENRHYKHPRVIHAEMNCLLHANLILAKKNIDLTMYCTHIPCSNCAAHMIQFGVTEVVFTKGYNTTISMVELQDLALKIFDEAGIKYYEI